jgi:hypothetical protein
VDCSPSQFPGKFIDSLSFYITVDLCFIQIHEHCYLRVNYENSVDWKQSTNHLWSSPSFHGHPHFNCTLIQLTADRTVFIWLILMFKCELLDIGAFQFALVQPYTAGVIGGSCRIDRDLRLTRVKAVPRADSIIIPLKSFIQGAWLCPNPTHQGEYLIINHVDSNMFLCMKLWAH